MIQGAIINVLLLASAVVSIIIAGIIYATDRRANTNLFLAVSLLFASLWGAAVFFTIFSGNILIGNVSFSAAGMIPPLLILFILSFREKLTSKKTWLVLIPAVFVALLVLLPESVAKEIATSKGYIELLVPGPLLWAYDLYFLVYVVILFYHLIRAKHEAAGIKVIQLNYLIFGLASSVVFGALFNIIFPLFKVFELNNLGPVFILFMSSTMAYASTKHYLKESQVIFSEVWAFILIFIVLVWLMLEMTAFNLFLLVLVLGVCIMFIRSVLSEAQKNAVLEKQKRELEKDKIELKALDRLKDDFLKMATHELNTPVTVIQGKMSMIFDENLGNFQEGQKEFLRPVFLNSSRLIKMIKEILDTLKVDQGEAELTILETDLAEVVAKIIEKLQKKADERQVKIVFHPLKAAVAKLKIDALKIQDVFENMLSNAIKFSKPGGQISVKIGIVDGFLVVSVLDNGAGISTADQRHIFEKFFQAKRFDGDSPQEQQGSGLGLYISKKFIEMHKGKIWFESKEGNGSKFLFALPIK